VKKPPKMGRPMKGGRGRMGRAAREQEITVCQIGEHSYLRIDGGIVPIKDYKILSSMHGCTELEVVMELDGKITEFARNFFSVWKSKIYFSGYRIEVVQCK